jgi:putative sigma-54 modulation protein
MSYELQISGQNIEVTEAIRTLTENKVAHMAHIYNKITHVHINFHVDKHQQIATGQVSVPGTVLAAEADSEDLYKSIDKLIVKLETQLRKYKEKHSG